jgi:hypothetical protein
LHPEFTRIRLENSLRKVLLLNAFAPTIDHFVVASNIKRRLARS